MGVKTAEHRFTRCRPASLEIDGRTYEIPSHVTGVLIEPERHHNSATPSNVLSCVTEQDGFRLQTLLAFIDDRDAGKLTSRLRDYSTQVERR